MRISDEGRGLGLGFGRGFEENGGWRWRRTIAIGAALRGDSRQRELEGSYRLLSTVQIRRSLGRWIDSTVFMDEAWIL